MCRHIWNSVYVDNCKFDVSSAVSCLQCMFQIIFFVMNIRFISVPERSFKYFFKTYLLYIQLIVLLIMCSV